VQAAAREAGLAAEPAAAAAAAAGGAAEQASARREAQLAASLEEARCALAAAAAERARDEAAWRAREAGLAAQAAQLQARPAAGPAVRDCARAGGGVDRVRGGGAGWRGLGHRPAGTAACRLCGIGARRRSAGPRGGSPLVGARGTCEAGGEAAAAAGHDRALHISITPQRGPAH